MKTSYCIYEKTKKYKYFYYGLLIYEVNFVKEVPENLEEEVNTYGTYSYCGYDAVEIDIDNEYEYEV